LILEQTSPDLFPDVCLTVLKMYSDLGFICQFSVVYSKLSVNRLSGFQPVFCFCFLVAFTTLWSASYACSVHLPTCLLHL
jgi:hypothetical protein